MKKINAARIIQLLKQPFVEVRPIIDDLRFADSKRHELNKLKSPCEEFYRRTPEIMQISKFETNTKEVLAFAEHFIKETFKEPELQAKLLSNLKGFEFTNKPEGNFLGACGCCVNEGAFNIEKWVYIGDLTSTKPIRFETDLYRIRTLLHETAHASSQKHDLDNFINKLNIDEELIKNNPQKAQAMYRQSIKDHGIGEIESLFMEKVFRHFLATKTDKIVADEKNMGLSSDQLQIEAYNLQRIEMAGFLNHIDFIKRPFNKNYAPKHRIFRYVIGEVGSRILFEKYLENPEEALKIYGEFLKSDAQLNIDEAMQMLSGGELNNYPEAMQKYIEIFEKKLKKLDAKDKTQKQDGYEFEKSN